MSKPVRHIFISAGEASGDRYGAALAAALRSLDPSLRLSALGGPALAAAGAGIVQDISGLAVMGFSEAARALPRLLKVRKNLVQFMAREKVDLVVPIDFPGFNGGLAHQARRRGVPVFWLVAPQHWAWGSWRTRSFRSRVTRLGTILPFEEDYFRSRGLDVFPMGHPLMEDYGGDFPFEQHISRREKHFSNREMNLTVGIFPGSRRQELDHLLPVLKVTCQALVGHQTERETRFLVSAAPGVDPIDLERAFDLPSEILQAPLKEILPEVDLALVCSGTASLEAALAGVPHEIVYRTGAFNHWLASRLVRTGRIGLSNIVLGENLVREHLQQDAAPLPLARDLLRWVARPSERQDFYSGVRRLRKLCGQPGVWQRTARAILELGTESPGD